MKKLSKLKLNKFVTLNEDEQRKIVGGMDMVWSNEFGCYMLYGVTVYGKRTCKGCQEFERRNNPSGAYGADKNSGGTIVTPLGEYLIKNFVIKHDPWCSWY